MVSLPKEIIDVLTNDDDGNMIVKKEATEQQKKIFEQFKKDLESGELSDVSIEYKE